MTMHDTEREENGVLWFDRTRYAKAARATGQCTLDGRVWTEEGYKEMREWSE